MFALLLLASAVQVPPSVQRLADYNVLIGSCERYMPRRMIAEMDAVTRGAPPEVRSAINEWREEGRRARAERPRIYNRRVCLGLYEVVGAY
jgi:hypothetical protein